MTSNPVRSPAPIVRSVEVPITPPRAFDIFTARMTDWWPLTTHSVFELDAASVHMTPEVGGQIVERSRDGGTSVWGTVLIWEPAVEVAFTWHAGGPPERATRVSVRFDPIPSGTRVVLVHDEWDRRADADAAYREYESGWAALLGVFRDVAAAG